MIRCPLCGHDFPLEQARKSCAACFLKLGCPFIRCPRCNYDFVPEPAVAKVLKERGKEKWR